MPTKVPMKIVIVGGVAGGMSAATRARRLDEKSSITVFEKGPYVSYANCGIPYALGGVTKDDAALILQTPRALQERFNIDIHVNTEVLSIEDKCASSMCVPWGKRQYVKSRTTNSSYPKALSPLVRRLTGSIYLMCSPSKPSRTSRGSKLFCPSTGAGMPQS